MNEFLISGIQQVGVGTVDLRKSWDWFIDMFGIDVKVIDDDMMAERMLRYTGGKPQKRHAIIAISTRGGSGLEVWQYSERKPEPIPFKVAVGDLGVFMAKIKCCDVAAYHQEARAKWDKTGPLSKTPDGVPCFLMEDPYGNTYQIIEERSVLIKDKRLTGGVIGAMTGVTDIEKSRKLYSDVLGYDKVIYDKTGIFEDLAAMEGGEQKCRRVLLERSAPFEGPVTTLYGQKSQIELVQALEGTPRKIFEGRYWGDPGFIQICFDIINMDAFKKFCAEKGFPFTVDSCPDKDVHFDMGDGAGRFTYLEDPDGSLIEFVEIEKIPISKKLGLSIDFTKRDRSKPLPKYVFWLLGVFMRGKSSKK